jgi:hypothetical protein
MLDGHVRVINTSSDALRRAPGGGIVWETLSSDEAGAAACKTLGRYRLYAQSKLVSLLLHIPPF